jgi:eukaryotic-like serine/threonine-protein kinase
LIRYTVERTLGRGGMATVELARDEQLGRRVAVKRLFASLAGDELFQTRFFREARMAAGLSHPNVVGVYDVGEEDGVPYIVMEYVDGETLAELMASGAPMDPDRAVDLLLQICAGLEHAHAAGLVHRDIKPQNLLVRRDGVAKIADFGIAKTLQATQLTEAGTVLGTATYLAPEQAAGQRVTAAADIYSLGAVAYELLTGRPPYRVESLADLARAQREPPTPLENVPPELSRAVLGALSADPQARPPSAAVFARELAQASPDAPTERLPRRQVTAATEVVSPPGRTVHVSRPVLFVLAALLAVALVAGGLALAFTDSGGESPAPTPPRRSDAPPRADAPAESARLLADWLRERAG